MTKSGHFSSKNHYLLEKFIESVNAWVKFSNDGSFIYSMYFIYLSKQTHNQQSLKVHFSNHVALAMKTECITLTMLERMRLICWVLPQGKALNAHAFRANWSRSKENSDTK